MKDFVLGPLNSSLVREILLHVIFYLAKRENQYAGYYILGGLAILKLIITLLVRTIVKKLRNWKLIVNEIILRSLLDSLL